MMKRIFFLFLAIQLLFSLKTKATHSVGGEMSVAWISGNNYQITCKLYRDCYNGIPQLDDPLIVSVFDSANNWLEDINIPSPVITQVPPNPVYFCLGSTNVCVEQGVYQIIHSFPPIPGGYVLANQRCCRTNAVINLDNPGLTGTTFTQSIPDSGIAYHNSSPYFNNYPPILICVSQQLNYNASTIDVDGDSLVYTLFNPFAGFSNSSPGPGTAAPPPFPLVQYTGAFNYLNPINSLPSISINSATGILTLTPTQLGQFVIGICCKEFRNGEFIGNHYLDFQFNVVQCSPATFQSNYSYIPTNGITCEGQGGFFFTNLSCSADSFNWDFGDGTFSNAINPYHIFNTPGIYSVILTAFDSTITDTTVHTFTVIAGPHASFTYAINGLTLHFTNTSTVGTTHQWDFGDGATSGANNPSHNFTLPFNYYVCLYVQDTTTGCSDDTCFWLYPTGINTQNISPQIFSSIIGNELFVKSDLLQHENKIRIFNSLGQEIILNEVSKTEKQIAFNISSLASGIYFIEITNAEEHAVGKFMKE